MEARHLLVSGRVQGVGFRAWTQHMGQALGLTGWVRNLADGRVEILVEGDLPALGHMLEACRSGPRSAAVDEVRVKPRAPEGHRVFEVRQSVQEPVEASGFERLR